MVQFLTSSTKIIVGKGFLANEKRAFVSFSISPNHYKTSGHNPKSINYELGKWKIKCKSSITKFPIETIGKWHDLALDWMFDYGGLFLQNITILSVETKRIIMTLFMSKVLYIHMHKYTIYLWSDGRTNDVDKVIAFESKVLPMPRGPNNSTPSQGCPTISQLQNQQRN